METGRMHPFRHCHIDHYGYDHHGLLFFMERPLDEFVFDGYKTSTYICNPKNKA